MYLNKTQYNLYRKQWRFLSKHLRKLTEQGLFQQFSEDKKNYLTTRLKSLFLKMLRFEKASKLKKALGVAALLLGFQVTPTLQAQVNFAPTVNNPFGLTHNEELNFETLVDIDGDGDLDIISVIQDSYAEVKDQIFTFIENDSQNEGTLSNFIEPVSDYTGLLLPNLVDVEYTNPTFGDIDNDGDLDMFIGAYDDTGEVYDAKIVYFENIGDVNNPAFAMPVENPFNIDLGISQISVPELADIDNDGDLDLFSTFKDYDYATETEDTRIDFLRNIGTPENPEFAATEHGAFGLPADFDSYRVYDLADIDNDGDIDMLAGGFIDFYDPYTAVPFTFFENTGDANNPQFGEGLINPFSLEPLLTFVLWPHLGDLDNDGDIDILTSSGYDLFSETATWTFHENLLDPSAIKELELNAEVNVFPSISKDFVNLDIKSETIQEYFQINVLDINGKLLVHKKLAGGIHLNERISLGYYPVGQYLIQVRTPMGMTTKKVIKQ